jgi:chromosome segregation ATPase
MEEASMDTTQSLVFARGGFQLDLNRFLFMGDDEVRAISFFIPPPSRFAPNGSVGLRQGLAIDQGREPFTNCEAFLQWEESYRNSQPLKTQNESLSREIASLRKDLEAKNKNIETLERRFDKFTAQLTEFGKDTGKSLQALQKKVKERESQIASLQNHPNENKDVGTNVVELTGKASKAAMRNQLAQLRAEGKRIIDKALSTPTSRPPADEGKQWFTTTIQYLQQNMDAGHVEEFRDPPAPDLHFAGVPVFARDLEARVKVLQRFTDELRAKN